MGREGEWVEKGVKDRQRDRNRDRRRERKREREHLGAWVSLLTRASLGSDCLLIPPHGS